MSKKNLIHTFGKVYFFNDFWFVKDDPEPAYNLTAAASQLTIVPEKSITNITNTAISHVRIR